MHPESKAYVIFYNSSLKGGQNNQGNSIEDVESGMIAKLPLVDVEHM